jgi:hypothetical protein
MSSAGRHVFSPLKYSMAGHDVAAEHKYTDGKYRLEFAVPVTAFPSPPGDFNTTCGSIEALLADARAGNNTQMGAPRCVTSPEMRWPTRIELKLQGPDMPQVAELKAGKRVNTSGGGLAAPVSWLAASVVAVASVAVLA